jgi:hypothetical protein
MGAPIDVLGNGGFLLYPAPPPVSHAYAIINVKAHIPITPSCP